MQINVNRPTCRLSVSCNNSIIIAKFRSLSLQDTKRFNSYSKQQLKDFFLSCQDAAQARLPQKSVTQCVNTMINLINRISYAQDSKSIQPRDHARAVSA